MKYKITEKYKAVIFSLKGKLLGGPEATDFNEAVRKYLNEGKKNIVIDLSGVTYVNSTGMGMLIRNYTTVANAGGKLKLASINERMRGLLSITKLNQIFEIYDTVDEAVKSFGEMASV